MKTVWITKRKRRGRAKGCRYVVRWTEDGRIHQRAAGTTMKEARTVRDQVWAEINGAVSERRLTGPRRTWEDFTEAEIGAIKGTLEPASVSKARSTLDRFFETCEPKSPADVGVEMIEQYRQARLAGGVKPATVNGDLRTLAAAFERARARGVIRSNPFRKVKLAKVPPRDIPILNETQRKALISAATDHSALMVAFVTVALDTGCRLQELLHLRWEDVNLSGPHAGRIFVRCRKDWRTKAKRNRFVGTGKAGIRALVELNRESEGHFVFRPDTVGKEYQVAFRRKFERVVKKAKVPRVTIHDLRANCVTNLAMGGMPPAALMAYAGHANITTTMRYYVRTQAGAVLRAAAEARAKAAKQRQRDLPRDTVRDTPLEEPPGHEQGADASADAPSSSVVGGVGVEPTTPGFSVLSEPLFLGQEGPLGVCKGVLRGKGGH